MQIDLSRYRVKLAETAAEREGAQRLRYRVFVEEMGAHATPEERAARREWDEFDPFFDHLILTSLDPTIEDPLDRVVGVYRLMRDEVAAAGPGFYGAEEYDLSAIAAAGRASVELGRSCVAKEHRGGAAMHLLWKRR
jgi:putative hemolysin